jgi:hypothetical protein
VGSPPPFGEFFKLPRLVDLCPLTLGDNHFLRHRIARKHLHSARLYGYTPVLAIFAGRNGSHDRVASSRALVIVALPSAPSGYLNDIPFVLTQEA